MCWWDVKPYSINQSGSGIIFTKFDLRQFSAFSRTFLGVDQNWQSFFWVARTQLHQTWPRHRAIIAALHFCFRIRISCCIFKRWRLKVESCFKRRQISHFLTPCENYGRVGEMPISFTYTTQPPKYIWWPSSASGGLITRKKVLPCNVPSCPPDNHHR